MGWIHLRTFTSRMGFIKGELLAGLRAPGFINRDFSWRTQISPFVRTYTYSMDSTHSFINEAPVLFSPFFSFPLIYNYFILFFFY